MTKPTGWDNGLSQDYDKGLGRWFADRLGARQQLRQDFEMTTYTLTEAKRQQLLAVLEEATTTDDGAAKWDRHSKATKVLQSLEPVKGEAVKFLANNTRFKFSFDACGRVNSFSNFERELDGRWVALVAAEDDCHIQLTHPLRELSDGEIHSIAHRKATRYTYTAKPSEVMYGFSESHIIDFARAIEKARGE